MMIDAQNTDEKVLKLNGLKPEDVAEWWIDPYSMDIEGIDTADALFDFKKKDSYKGNVVGRNIAVMAKGQNQKDKIREHIKTNFTTAEINQATRKHPILISVKPIDNAGGFIAADDDSYIEVNPYYVDSAHTTVHEFIHLLKYKGGLGGRDTATKTRIPKGKDPITKEDRNLEEASTTAETIARATPFDPSHTSYYGRLGGNAAEKIKSDRILFAGNNKPGGKGLIGKAAVESVESKFNKSEIGKLQTYNTTKSASEYMKNLKK